MSAPALPPPRTDAGLYEWFERAIGVFGFAELAVAAVFMLIAFTAPHLGRRSFERIEGAFSGLAWHPVRQIVFVGLLAIVGRALLLPWLGAPHAVIHDEQSLLLQAQTFMSGRLANPVHPFWEHFETFHLNQVPAYASMYFPGRSAPLTLGLLVADNAWVGIWISMVLLCMSAVWMLQGWVSLPMALLGGVLVAVRLSFFSYWINSYWGGAFAAFGAMLVIGALPRLLKGPQWQHGVVMGLGATILMVTRPYEGALLCVPVAVVLATRLVRPSWQGGRLLIARVALPAVLMLGAGGVLLLNHNAATTGDFLKTPYSVNRDTYAKAPAFLTSPPVRSQQRGPAYFRDFYEAESTAFDRSRYSKKEVVRGVAAKLLYTWNFYIGATLAVAFIVGLWSARRRYFLWGALAFFFAGYFLETWNFPHYTAPIYPVILIITMLGFQGLRTWVWRGKPVGVFLTRAMPAAAIALLALPASSLWFGKPALEVNAHSNICCAIGGDNLRSRLVKSLLASPGRDLILVKDGPHNPIHFEMVYNGPDIDNAEIVWARRLSPAQDRRLQAHLSDRRVWQFEWRPDLPLGYALTALEPAAEPGRPLVMLDNGPAR